VNTSSVGVHITDTAAIKGEIDCVSPEGAERVRDALKGAVGLARLNTRNDQMGILRLYDAIKINQKDTTVTIDADIASDLLQQVLKMLPELRNGSNTQLQQLIPK
jgi:tRNA U34 5-carboxymethylaminomethyl modifying GTPase MnmE/TrmE